MGVCTLLVWPHDEKLCGAQLDLRLNHFGAEGAKALGEALEVNRTLVFMDGLQIKQLKGIEPVESIDLSHKEIGMVSGVFIAKCIAINAFVTQVTSHCGERCTRSYADRFASVRSWTSEETTPVSS